MKKNPLKLIIAALIISASLGIQSCSEDEYSIITIPAIGIAQDPGNFKGDIPSGQTVTLDPTQTYQLTGSVVIKNGGKLVIPAGTRIVATVGASAFVIVEQGGQLFANGTSGSPVLFTSSDKTAGSWGGIVVCGKAPINVGPSATSEIGNSMYGGTDTADTSGSLSFVRVEYAGAVYTGDKKFNGLSLFGVGNTTKVENVALVNGGDDGIQLYGGTVNVSNIVSLANDNNAFVWSEGWKGTASNIFTKRKADGTGNTGIKGMNNPNNQNAAPRSNPTIKNVTFIGGTTGEADAIQLKSGTYANLENVVISNWNTGVNLESDSTVAYFNGKKRMKDVLFDSNVTTKVSAKSSAGNNVAILDSTYIEKADATGAGNGIATPAWATGWSGLQ